MVSFSCFTDKGSRFVNEDSVITACKGDSHLFVVCDGLGGHGRGEVASALATRGFVNCFNNSDNFIDDIGAAFEYVQKRLLEEQTALDAKNEMKTTAVVLAVADNRIRWGYIGDSRLYMFKKSHMKERTTDHSVPQMLALSGRIKEKEIRFHPDRNKLLHVMGTEWKSNAYKLSEIRELKRDVSFLLCTDGFWELIDEKEMSKSLKKSISVEDWLTDMSNKVRKRGEGMNMDNYSAIAVNIKG